MRLIFKINSLRQEEKRIRGAKKNKKWYNNNHYICVLPKISLKDEYLARNYQIDKITENWKKVEKDFFKKIKIILNFQPKKIFVYFTKYGVGGSYSLPDKVIINISDEYRRFVSYKTIAHEIIHLAVEDYMVNNKIDHQTKERIVSFIEKELMSF